MLKCIEIENIAVIEKASIDFDSGFNVLTGETGAGKSIIIDSINAILGFRTSKDLVRTGARSAMVVAEFSGVGSNVEKKLYELDIEPEPDCLILQRKIGADGKSSCRINGRPVSVGTLKEVGSLLINIHGQHDNQKLLDSDKHYIYIDRMMDDDALIDEYEKSYRELCEIIRSIKSLDVDEKEKQKQLEQYEFEIDEIESADIKIGEKEELLKEKKFLNSVADLLDALNFAKLNIDGDDENLGAATQANSAFLRLSSLDSTEELKGITDKLGETAIALSALNEEIRNKIEAFNVSPERIDTVEDRLNMYYNFSNKYGNTEEDILEYLKTTKKKVRDIRFADERKAELERSFSIKKEETYKLALELSDKRRKTAEEFGKKVENELHFLDMTSAQFKVDFKDSPICKRGIDEIEFLISVNAGEELKPLANVASGGELSRIMLAFRSVFGKKEEMPTLIFDEIDTGVSGRAAQKVGLKLRQVSENSQVICVTHLAQIAAMARAHYLIHKQVAEGRTYTKVQRLTVNERKYELARIMGGTNISKLMLENAEEMLKEFN